MALKRTHGLAAVLLLLSLPGAEALGVALGPDGARLSGCAAAEIPASLPADPCGGVRVSNQWGDPIPPYCDWASIGLSTTFPFLYGWIDPSCLLPIV